uniref:Uncharacterized protein n=1 Tax=Eutreptiella gymnastica TaxID=73025 RepID=A0A7S4D0M7_9EUGL
MVALRGKGKDWHSPNVEGDVCIFITIALFPGRPWRTVAWVDMIWKVVTHTPSPLGHLLSHIIAIRWMSLEQGTQPMHGVHPRPQGMVMVTSMGTTTPQLCAGEYALDPLVCLDGSASV